MQSRAIHRAQIVLGALFLAAGAAKLAGADIMVRQVEVMGLGQGFRLLFGSLEIIYGLCLFIPRAAIYAALLLAGIEVGAAGATVGHVASPAPNPVTPATPRLTVFKSYRASLSEREPVRASASATRGITRTGLALRARPG